MAQFRLGAMYAEGKGVSQDYVQAYKWRTLGGQRLCSPESAVTRWGTTNSVGAKFKAKMSELEAKMSSEQIAESKKLIKQFVPKESEITLLLDQ
jgi:hypothetical protein